MRRAIAAIALFVLLLGLSLQASEKTAYKSALKAWSRSHSFYGGPDFFAKLAWTATYMSPEFLNARLEEAAQRLGLSDSERDLYWKEHLEPLSLQPTFFIAFYTERKEWNALDPKASTLWQLRLIQGDRRCEPLAVESQKRASPETLYFFPYVEKWDKPYLLRFPASCTPILSEPFQLDIQGLYGHSTLEWGK